MRCVSDERPAGRDGVLQSGWGNARQRGPGREDARPLASRRKGTELTALDGANHDCPQRSAFNDRSGVEGDHACHHVVKCTNDGFPNLYSCGAAGVRRGQNGNLFQRLKSHARDWRSRRQSNGSQLYRHEVSPFKTTVWALHLVSWTEIGVQLAEHALHFRLSLAFPSLIIPASSHIAIPTC